MGCVVNGPGDRSTPTSAFPCPARFEEPKAPVYVDGRLFTTLKGDRIVAEFIGILDDTSTRTYAARDTVIEEVPPRSRSRSALPVVQLLSSQQKHGILWRGFAARRRGCRTETERANR